MSRARESAIAAWAAPQARFETLRSETQRRAGRDLCDLGYANLYDGPPSQVKEILHAAIDRERTLDLQYTPYGGATIPRRLVAQSLRASHGEEFRWRHVVLTPGAMAGLNLLFRAVRTGGRDEVIVPVPCWLDYPLYLENLGFTPRLVPLDPKRFDLDLAAIRGALGSRTRAVVLSQPGNPTGRLYPDDQLRALGALLDGHRTRPLLISDECHRDVRFDAAPFVSPLHHYDRTCIVYSFGKSLALQGQRIGYVAVSPRMSGSLELASRLEGLCRTMGFCTPTALMQNALSGLMRVRPDWTQVAARRARVLEAFESTGPEVIPSDASFFLYCRAGRDDDFAVAEALAAREVLVLPSSLFHDVGHLRLSLTCSDAMLERALPVIAEIVSRGSAT